MSNPKTMRFLLITERDSTGYIIGFFDDLEEAEKVMNELSSTYSTFWKIGTGQEFEKAMNYRSYKVHPLINQGRFENCERCIFDGYNFIRIIDTEEVENFSLERFLFERANTILLYDFNITSKQKTRFEIHPEFIAN